MTVREALNAGYKYGDVKYERGYMSRRCTTEEEDRKVHTAGGNRKGDLYFYKPCYHTSQYVYRQYLYK